MGNPQLKNFSTEELREELELRELIAENSALGRYEELCRLVKPLDRESNPKRYAAAYKSHGSYPGWVETHSTMEDLRQSYVEARRPPGSFFKINFMPPALVKALDLETGDEVYVC